MKNTIINFGAIMILSSLLSCSQISSKEEALEVLKNSEWEFVHETEGFGLGFDEVSTYMYFDSEGFVYMYAKKGGFSNLSKSSEKAFPYEVKFTKGKHNVIQICINGCDNPNVYYLDSDNPDKIAYFGLGAEETFTRNIKRVK